MKRGASASQILFYNEPNAYWVPGEHDSPNKTYADDISGHNIGSEAQLPSDKRGEGLPPILLGVRDSHLADVGEEL